MNNWREHWEEFSESKRGLFGAALTLLLIAAALLAPAISPQDPYDLTQLFLDKSNLAPTLFKSGPIPTSCWAPTARAGICSAPFSMV
jgi:ABC-type antimicrobial peptide transport system permease subunit